MKPVRVKARKKPRFQEEVLRRVLQRQSIDLQLSLGDSPVSICETWSTALHLTRRVSIRVDLYFAKLVMALVIAIVASAPFSIIRGERSGCPRGAKLCDCASLIPEPI